VKITHNGKDYDVDYKSEWKTCSIGPFTNSAINYSAIRGVWLEKGDLIQTEYCDAVCTGGEDLEVCPEKKKEEMWRTIEFTKK